MARFDTTAPVVEQRRAGRGMYLITLEAPEIAGACAPGQFCMLDVRTGCARDPLLRRPLSVHAVTPPGRVQFLYRQVGRGTGILSRRREGDSVGVLGPLGRGFSLGHTGPCVLVGGGMGAAPLLFLARELARTSARVHVVLGARCAEEIPRMDAFSADAGAVAAATEDGSLGLRGLVTDLLARELRGFEAPPRLFACGPWPMLRAVHLMAREGGLSCEVSLEARMACGTGLCLGCAVAATGGGGYLHVCTHGPVFPSGEVDWDACRE